MIIIAQRRQFTRLARMFSSSEDPLNRENPFGEGDKAQLKTEKVNPTMTESFAKQFSEEEVKKYLDPMGFLKDIKEKERYTSVAKEAKEQDKKPFPNELNEQFEQFGFKYQGKEPTRFGDWEHKGRCTDF